MHSLYNSANEKKNANTWAIWICYLRQSSQRAEIVKASKEALGAREKKPAALRNLNSTTKRGEIGQWAEQGEASSSNCSYNKSTKACQQHGLSDMLNAESGQDRKV